MALRPTIFIATSLKIEIYRLNALVRRMTNKCRDTLTHQPCSRE